MANPNFKFCGEVITKQREYEELTIDKFNDDMVEVVRKYTAEHPDVRVRKSQTSERFIVRNFGYKDVQSAIDYFNEQTKK
jgi:hypothetical protein